MSDSHDAAAPTAATTGTDTFAGAWTVTASERRADGVWRLTLTGPGGAIRHVDAVADGADVWTGIDGVVRVIAPAAAGGARRRARAAAGHGLEAPMPATVTRVVVTPGQTVAAGDVLVLLEAMKMELAIRAPRDGVVARIACEAGTLVQPGVPLVELT
jgi:biotin carboxyl carrier protein